MNSPNQPTRQYHHNTCELSIEDKKSPFPAWMKFNKPNPLKFSLSLQDPDRPAQPPISISGDRVKLDALHQTVEDYVSKLIAKAPLPLFESSRVEDGPSPLSNGLMATDGSGSVSMERPIDALKMTGDQPHIEPDGPSRHLLYLGNMTTDGQVMSSLSTLQLFDLSSTLEEATQPVAITEQSSAALHNAVGQQIEPEVTATESATTPPTAIPTPPLVAQKFETDVEEPRVILPSVAESKESNIPDTLESQSSFFDRNSLANSTNRFRGPKPSLGSLNLPELPDFSNSPLTSIWLWLGLGTVATGILAFPFLSKSFSDTTASKPAVQSSPSASTESTINPGIPSYQPSSPTTPNGLANSSTSSTYSPGSITSSGAGGTGAATTGTPQLTYGTNSGLNQIANANGAIAGQPVTKNGLNNPASNTTVGGNRSLRTDLAAATAGIGNQQQRKVPTDPLQGGGNQGGSNSENRGNNTTPRVNTNTTRVSSGTGVVADPDGTDFEQKGQPDLSTSSTNRNSSTNSQTKRPRRSKPTTSSTTSVTAQGQDLTDVPAGNNSSLDTTPITTPPTDNSSPLSAPPNNRQLSGDSPQVNAARQYVQSRWKADPGYSESLQYTVTVGKNGRVTAIQGQTSASREYLSRTSFIKPGTPVAESSNREQSMQVILRPDGSTEVLSNP
jgi:hypothetical protein